MAATTHKESKLHLLSEADEAILDDGSLKGKIKGVTKVLDLAGPKSLKDTLYSVENGTIVCNTGNLGGVYSLNYFDPIKDIPNGVYLTGFFSNYPTQKIMSDIFKFIDQHHIQPEIGTLFSFDDIDEACKALDNGSVDGKIVVVI